VTTPESAVHHTKYQVALYLTAEDFGVIIFTEGRKMKSCSVNNYLQRDGFVMVSNLLIDYQNELGLSNSELNFIIKTLRHKENYKLHDNQLDPTVSKRTLQRYRKKLTEIGYLEFKVWKYTDEKGHIHTEGITYDWTNLEKRLQEISDAKAAKKEAEINQEAEDYIIEFGENSPMAKFLTDWENHYGDTYFLNPLEKNWYNNLSKEEQELIGRIFDYCEDNKLFKSITPRLALFMKSKQRFNQLKRYAKDIPEEFEVPDHVEVEERELTVEEQIEKLKQEIKEFEEKGEKIAASVRKEWLKNLTKK